MPFAQTIIQGKRGLFRLSDPAPKLMRSRTDVDQLRETWSADFFDDLIEGQTHPQRPGMIIDQIDATEEMPSTADVPGIYTLDVTSLGSYDNTRPLKILAENDAVTLAAGFDRKEITYLAWSDARSITGSSSTNKIYCPGHRFAAGARVLFRDITGGSGIMPATIAGAVGTMYYVINPTALDFQVAITAGGSAVSLGTDITAGTIEDGTFAKGHPHPDWSQMYLTAVTRSRTANSQWFTYQCTYEGIMQGKSYNRIITCNGQVMSGRIAWDFPDASTDVLNREVQLPEIVITDTKLMNGSLPTMSIPLTQSEGGTPIDAPSMRSIYIYGSDDVLVYPWPNGWTFQQVNDSAVIAGTNIRVVQYVYRYVFPVKFK